MGLLFLGVIVGVLYRGYCYDSAETVGSLVMSDQVRDGSSPWYIAGFTVGSGSISYSVSVLSGGTVQTSPVSVPLVNCSTLGPASNLTGLSVSDVTQVSWMVAAVLVSAWAIKSIRRAM